MAYSDMVLDHYENPRNVGSFDQRDRAVGTGLVGAPASGEVMKLQIRVAANGVIEDACFKTYGCGSAIAATSFLSEWVKGKTLAQARQLHHVQIVEAMVLPAAKIHCAILAEDALKAALRDYCARQPAARAGTAAV